jgi:hypothetical protein
MSRNHIIKTIPTPNARIVVRPSVILSPTPWAWPVFKSDWRTDVNPFSTTPFNCKIGVHNSFLQTSKSLAIPGGTVPRRRMVSATVARQASNRARLANRSRFTRRCWCRHHWTIPHSARESVRCSVRKGCGGRSPGGAAACCEPCSVAARAGVSLESVFTISVIFI